MEYQAAVAVTGGGGELKLPFLMMNGRAHLKYLLRNYDCSDEDRLFVSNIQFFRSEI